MKTYILFLITLLVFTSCEPKKNIELPRIKTPAIQNVQDISQAFIFYNPKEKDSTELNSNNLISTTNWIVHVDKRLKLYQALPKIQALQQKHSANSPHKNDNAKNYFSVANAKTKQLNFIDFTQVVYHNITPSETDKDTTKVTIFFSSENVLSYQNKTYSKEELTSFLKESDTIPAKKIILKFNTQLNFQDYISDLEFMLNIPLKNLKISPEQKIISE